MSTINGVDVYLQSDEELVITTRNKSRSDKPVFMMIGSPVKVRNRPSGFPIMKTMCEFNKEEQWFFKLLLDNLNTDTNMCDISHIEFTSTEIPKVSRAYRPMFELGLVKRFKKGIYMINPTAIIPPTSYEEVQARWDSF
jgi:hypothetical protein